MQISLSRSVSLSLNLSVLLFCVPCDTIGCFQMLLQSSNLPDFVKCLTVVSWNNGFVLSIAMQFIVIAHLEINNNNSAELIHLHEFKVANYCFSLISNCACKCALWLVWETIHTEWIFPFCCTSFPLLSM